MVTPKFSVKEGPANLIQTRGITTTSSVSTLRKLIAKRYLAEGNSDLALPASRRNDRLFGEKAVGRSSSARVAHACMKLMGADYDPRTDSVLKAFVRMLAELAEPEMAQECQE